MALGHEKLAVFRLAIGYVAWVFEYSEKLNVVQEEPSGQGIDPDEMKTQPDAALNADKPRE